MEKKERERDEELRRIFFFLKFLLRKKKDGSEGIAKIQTSSRNNSLISCRRILASSLSFRPLRPQIISHFGTKKREEKMSKAGGNSIEGMRKNS